MSQKALREASLGNRILSEKNERGKSEQGKFGGVEIQPEKLERGELE